MGGRGVGKEKYAYRILAASFHPVFAYDRVLTVWSGDLRLVHLVEYPLGKADLFGGPVHRQGFPRLVNGCLRNVRDHLDHRCDVLEILFRFGVSEMKYSISLPERRGGEEGDDQQSSGFDADATRTIRQTLPAVQHRWGFA
jgi:hypothetical protein